MVVALHTLHYDFSPDAHAMGEVACDVPATGLLLSRTVSQSRATHSRMPGVITPLLQELFTK
jgi:hypothetical protein